MLKNTSKIIIVISLIFITLFTLYQWLADVTSPITSPIQNITTLTNDTPSSINMDEVLWSSVKHFTYEDRDTLITWYKQRINPDNGTIRLSTTEQQIMERDFPSIDDSSAIPIVWCDGSHTVVHIVDGSSVVVD